MAALFNHSIVSFFIYLAALVGAGIFFSAKERRKASFSLTQSRSLNYWVAAISAHASDMSNWLFMGFPATVTLVGLGQLWVAIGLVTCMWANWHFVAPRLRAATETYDTFTLAGYFSRRFEDKGTLHLLCAFVSLLFFSFYVASGFIGFGILFESLFSMPYEIGLLIAVGAVLIYTLLGGFVAVAWTDFFQGLFLLIVILFVPLYIYFFLPQTQNIAQAMSDQSFSTDFFLTNNGGFLSIAGMFFGWGLGYFGQPHILNKFMGISNPKDLTKAKWIGISWQCLTLSAAFCIGVLSLSFFDSLPENRDLIFIEMVHELFSPFITGFIMCGILAATISTVDSQILALTTIVCDDLFKTFYPQADQKSMKTVSRFTMLLICICAVGISVVAPNRSIYNLVQYAWSGLGASFGPLLIFSLCSQIPTRRGAIASILCGSGLSGLWPYIKPLFSSQSPLQQIPELIPGFILSSLAIVIFSLVEKTKTKKNVL